MKGADEMESETGITITEALAQIKTIEKRLDKKRQFVLNYLMRQEQLKDPLDKEGGSRVVIARERQAIGDLEQQIIRLRRAIQAANQAAEISVGGRVRTIADWLVWRREVAPGAQAFLSGMSSGIQSARNQARMKGLAVVTTGDVATQPTDIIINVDELALSREIEAMEEVLGNLDGQLSLKNATTRIEP
jgi:hypothetical protein